MCTNKQPLLKLENICFAYDDLVALRHVSFDVEAGETVILQGDNGCGKSTLLKLMNGLLFPNEGQYTYMGKAITEASLKDETFAKWLHREIGFIWQNADVQLFCGCVEEEIAFGPQQMGLPEAEVKERVQSMLQLLDIERLRYRAPYQLSGGEKRKVSLACILVLNPQVLVLDEPLAGLDKKSQLWLVELLQSLHKAGKTLVIATHNEKLAQLLGTKFVVMNEEHEIISVQNILKQ